MNYQNVGFIGCGNMGGALASCAAQGLKRQGSGKLLLSDADPNKAAALAGRTGGLVSGNEEIAKVCDLIFLAVKPQMLADMLAGIAPLLSGRNDRFVLVSMVAGVPIERVQALAGGAYPLIRIMPNTAAFIGAGMIQLCASGAGEDEVAAFRALMADAGVLDELPERLIDAASAVSGCGPAYLCLALEGMADGGVSLGLPRDKALLYAAQTIAGLGKLAVETGLHPGVLKDQVTSPGGTTIQGVRTLENYSTRAAFMEAVIAAYDKTIQLKEGT